MEKTSFNCLGQNCPAHCCKSFAGLSKRIKNGTKTRFQDIILTDEDVKKIKNRGLSKVIVTNEEGLTCMKVADDGTCSQCENGRCAIYDVRPAICRAYPLYLDMFAGVCYDSQCPATNESTEFIHDEKMTKALIEIYSFWLSKLS